MKKKLVAALLTAAMAMSLLAGCGSSEMCIRDRDRSASDPGNRNTGVKSSGTDSVCGRDGNYYRAAQKDKKESKE